MTATLSAEERKSLLEAAKLRFAGERLHWMAKGGTIAWSCHGRERKVISAVFDKRAYRQLLEQAESVYFGEMQRLEMSKEQKAS